MVSLEHGNFILNLGSATAADVLELVSAVQVELSMVGADLELEWRLWGF
jgi:UDP-N-acetylmuramate dehydrogenase